MGKTRLMLTGAAITVTGAAAATLAVRGAPVKSLAALAVAVASPYVAALSLIGVGPAAWYRRRVLSAVALGVAAVGVGVQASWYYRAHLVDPGEHRTIRVLSANIRHGEAVPASFVRLAAESADVVVTVELTPEAQQNFSAAGIAARFPYSHLMPAPLAGGIGIWSRFPLTPLQVPEHPSATAPAALLSIPGAALQAVLVAVHVKSPLADGRDTVGEWGDGIAYIGSQLDRFAMSAGAGAVIVAGDFNATPDVRQFRDLLTGGYRDSVEQLGAGFSPTFPAGRWYPPLFTIDHVLTRNSAASSIRTVPIAGSDHRGLIAEIEVPGGR